LIEPITLGPKGIIRAIGVYSGANGPLDGQYDLFLSNPVDPRKLVDFVQQTRPAWSKAYNIKGKI
jgi:hypothetical protein